MGSKWPVGVMDPIYGGQVNWGGWVVGAEPGAQRRWLLRGSSVQVARGLRCSAVHDAYRNRHPQHRQWHETRDLESAQRVVSAAGNRGPALSQSLFHLCALPGAQKDKASPKGGGFEWIAPIDERCGCERVVDATTHCDIAAIAAPRDIAVDRARRSRASPKTSEAL